MAPVIPSSATQVRPKAIPTYAAANAGPMGAAAEVRRRESLMYGRRSTILTSGLGLAGDPSLRVHSLLGS